MAGYFMWFGYNFASTLKFISLEKNGCITDDRDLVLYCQYAFYVISVLNKIQTFGLCTELDFSLFL